MNSTSKVIPSSRNETIFGESAFVPRITDGVYLETQHDCTFDGLSCEDVAECPVLVSPDKLSKRMFALQHEGDLSRRMADNIKTFRSTYKDAIDKYESSKQ